MRFGPWARRLIAFSAAVGLVVACTPDRSDTVVVLAARSLTEVFADLEAAYEEANPGTDVEMSFAGTAELVAQIEQGAPADVFASADVEHMDAVVDGEYASGAPRTFAHNRLAIVVEDGNPREISSLDDLARDVDLALCDSRVPCGSYAREMLARGRVAVKPVTETDNVKSVVTLVAFGEVDAGIVYATDVAAAQVAGEPVEAVPIPDKRNVVVSYPIVVLETAQAREAATAFVEFVTSEQGRSVLTDHGFEAP